MSAPDLPKLPAAAGSGAPSGHVSVAVEPGGIAGDPPPGVRSRSGRLARRPAAPGRWHGLRHRKLAAASAVLVIGLIAFCFLGPVLYHTDQLHASLVNSDLPPGAPHHPLGTDDLGFDELGRLMLGGRLSLEVGLAAAVFATAFGAVWGAIAGYFGGLADSLMMRIVDALASIPSLFILIFVAHTFTLNLPMLIVLISYVAWLGPARLVRGEVITVKVREFVLAGHTMGGGARHAIGRHLLPNTAGTMLVNASFQVADAILYVAALGYLGISLPPPSADWGTMLSSGTQFTQAGYWWMVVCPGVAIVLVVLAFNIIGDALSDTFTTRTLGSHA